MTCDPTLTLPCGVRVEIDVDPDGLAHEARAMSPLGGADDRVVFFRAPVEYVVPAGLRKLAKAFRKDAGRLRAIAREMGAQP